MSKLTSLLRAMRRDTRGVRAGIAGNILCGLASVGLSLAAVWCTRAIVDDACAHRLDAVYRGGALLCALFLARLLASKGAQRLEAWSVTRFSNRMRSRMFGQIMLGGHRDDRGPQLHSADVVNRLTSDIGSLSSAFCSTLPAMAVAACSLLGSFAYLATLAPQVALAVTLLMPLAILAGKIPVARSHRLTRLIRQGEGALHRVMQENVSHRLLVATLGHSPRAVDDFARRQRRYFSLTMRRNDLGLLASGAVTLGFMAGYAVMFIYCARGLALGTVSFATMTALLQLVAMVQRPAVDLSHRLSPLVRASVALDRLAPLSAPAPADPNPASATSTAPDPAPASTAKSPAPAPDLYKTYKTYKTYKIYKIYKSYILSKLTRPSGAGHPSEPPRQPEPSGSGIRPGEQSEPISPAVPGPLTLEDVWYRYSPGGDWVLRGLTATIPTGKVTTVFGETGAGKTTLLRLILGTVSPTRGRIANPYATADFSRIVYVPQGNSLLSGTIRSNLLMGKPDATPDEIRLALHTAAAGFVYALPAGLDTPCGESGHGLSEGQAQRIAIARALLRLAALRQHTTTPLTALRHTSPQSSPTPISPQSSPTPTSPTTPKSPVTPLEITDNPPLIMLLDEPTSALDPQTETQLLDRLIPYLTIPSPSDASPKTPHASLINKTPTASPSCETPNASPSPKTPLASPSYETHNASPSPKTPLASPSSTTPHGSHQHMLPPVTLLIISHKPTLKSYSHSIITLK